MSVTRIMGGIRPSEAAIGGGVEAQRRARITRRQALVDAARSLPDDELADLLETAERIASDPNPGNDPQRRHRLREMMRALYRICGWED